MLLRLPSSFQTLDQQAKSSEMFKTSCQQDARLKLKLKPEHSGAAETQFLHSTFPAKGLKHGYNDPVLLMTSSHIWVQQRQCVSVRVCVCAARHGPCFLR